MGLHVASLVISFCVGILVMLCVVPTPSVIVKFPRPDTDDREYRSRDGTCFKVTARKVSCKSSGPVLPQPIGDAETTRGQGVAFRLPTASST